jgi:uncharacterized protein
LASGIRAGCTRDRSSHAPVIVEIVDSEEKIEAFLPVLDEMMESGLVTLEKAKVLQYGRSRVGLLDRIKSGLRHHSAPSGGPADAMKT